MERQTRTSYRVFAASSKRRLQAALLAAAMGVQLAASGCVPIRDYRGFVAKEESLEQLRIGASKAEVEEVMGTPTTTSSISGSTYYYISSVFETTAFFEPEEVDRTVYAVEFDELDRVSRLAHYGLKDGKVFDFISRTTPTRGKELTLVQQFFGNLGRFNSEGSFVQDQIRQRTRN